MLSTLLPGYGSQPSHGGAHALPRGSRPTGAARTAAARAGEEESEGGTFFGALAGFGGAGTKPEVTGEWEDDESEEEDEQEDTSQPGYLVKMRVMDDVYGACFVIAMRGLRDRKLGTVVMAWVWVALSIFLTFVVGNELFHAEKPMLAGFVSGGRWGDASSKALRERLQEALRGERPLSSHNATDKGLLALCQNQPSIEFSFLIQFIWACRCMGQFTQTRTLLSMLVSCPVKDLRGATIVEDNGSMTIAAMLPLDSFLFGLVLVIPKALMASFVWWVGSRSLAYADDFMDLLFRAVSQHYITTIERQVFAHFIAHSKKEWVSRARVVQERTNCFRIFLSWPGEAMKLVIAISLLAIVIHHYRSITHLRDQCFDCIHGCPNVCSKDFGDTCPTSASVVPALLGINR